MLPLPLPHHASSFLILTLSLLATGTVVLAQTSGVPCLGSTGQLQCCLTVQPASNPQMAHVLEDLGVQGVPPDTPCGLACTPVTSIGLSMPGCNANLVCCKNNDFAGVCAIDCSPVTIIM